MKGKIYLLFFILIVSCNKGLEKPKNFIDKDKMIEVLYDLALFSGMESTSAFAKDTTVAVINVNSVLKKHGLDSLTFAENNKYYIELSDGTYHIMQKEIEDRLVHKKEELEKQEQERKEEEERGLKEKLETINRVDSLNLIFKREINDSIFEKIPQRLLEKQSLE